MPVLSKNLLSLTAAVAGALMLSACGDFAKNRVCLITADPGCLPDTGNFETPNLIGPNPNFPDPNAFKSAPGRMRLDGAPSKAPIRINELLLNPRGGVEFRQKIEFLNDTTRDFDASGYTIRFDDAEWAFPDGAIVPAGRFAVLHLGLAGESGGMDFYAPEVSAVDPMNGGMALISPKGVVSDYVQWGDGSELEELAVAEGQWLAGTSCVPPVEGASLSFVGDGNLATDFTARWESIGRPNR
jgi:hypothetical protein